MQRAAKLAILLAEIVAEKYADIQIANKKISRAELAEISRAIRWKNKGNADRMHGAVERALELIDLSIRWAQQAECRRMHPGAIRELCRLRETVCDSYLGENDYATGDEAMRRYFDRFALVARK